MHLISSTQSLPHLTNSFVLLVRSGIRKLCEQTSEGHIHGNSMSFPGQTGSVSSPSVDRKRVQEAGEREGFPPPLSLRACCGCFVFGSRRKSD